MLQSRTLGIIVHGGVGTIADKSACADGLVPAIEEGYRLLRQSASAQEAVVTAVRILEESGLYNAGSGAELNADGQQEMDAALMTQDGRFGGVCCISGVRNPILVAEKVMLDTDYLLLAGEGARQFARRCGFAESDEVSESARQRLQQFTAASTAAAGGVEQTVSQTGADAVLGKDTYIGTVGAVAVDKHGALAVASSAGGPVGRLRGRVSDTAIIGAGIYAGPSGAVACAGQAEEIMRGLLAREIVAKMATMPGSVAVTLAMAEARRRKIRCGVIGFDAHGAVCYGHTTPELAYGYKVAERLFLFVAARK